MISSCEEQFKEQYEELKKCFVEQVELDRCKYPNSVFLPNIPPKGPVDFVFVGMEPSYDKYAKNRDDAERQISSGYRNFMYSLEDFILHYCIRHYLCNDGSQYYITDLSKGAMKTKIANKERRKRYQDWYPLLQKELSLVAKNTAKIIAIGQCVKQFLDDQGQIPTPIYFPHYANTNNKWRKDYITNNHLELEFEKFKSKDAPSHPDILREAKTMMIEWEIPQSIIDNTINRLSKSNFTDSRYKLLFVCAKIFNNFISPK